MKKYSDLLKARIAKRYRLRGLKITDDLHFIEVGDTLRYKTDGKLYVVSTKLDEKEGLKLIGVPVDFDKNAGIDPNDCPEIGVGFCYDFVKRGELGDYEEIYFDGKTDDSGRVITIPKTVCLQPNALYSILARPVDSNVERKPNVSQIYENIKTEIGKNTKNRK